MEREKGKLVYKVYRAVSYTLSPLIHLHLRWRKLLGLEHPTRWAERLGRPSLRRPPGPLLWFHAVSLGEGMAAIPVIKHCMRERPDLNILMTTTTLFAFEVLKHQLPSSVVYQFAPLDAPAAVDAFLGYWKPNTIVLIESELWPNLVMSAAKSGIKLALVNARISGKSFRRWSTPIVSSLVRLMLSKFTLIVPLSTTEAIRFQLLLAPPFIINFSGDLKYCVGVCDAPETVTESIADVHSQLAQRMVWMASSIHKGEDEEPKNRFWTCFNGGHAFVHQAMLRVHKVLMQCFPNIMTILVPRHPQHGEEFALVLKKQELNVAVRSNGDKVMPGTSIYMVDTLGELRQFYRLTPVAVIGGSFLPGLAGHNISEAAAAGCAVITGPHVGHFSHMISAMQRVNPLAVLQVPGEVKLINALQELFSDPITLEARRSAAKQAFDTLSSGVVAHLWNLLDWHVLEKSVDPN